jgi:hypothetical protein
VEAVIEIDVVVIFVPFVPATFTVMVAMCVLQCYKIALNCCFGS